jgi:hypothetical protein
LLAGNAWAQSGPARPIRLNPENPHYFLYRGRTIVLITSGEHYGAVINTAVDYDRYLATLQADGLNYTRIFAGSYVEVPGKSFGIQRNDLAPAPGKFLAPWARSSTPGYAGGGNKFDLNRWNPAYFRRLRAFLADAARRGIVVEITFFSSQYGEAQWKLSPFNPANNVNGLHLSDWKKINTLENNGIVRYQEAYVRRIVREVNPFGNVIFEIQNEPWSDRPAPAGVINPYLFPPARDNFPNNVQTADALSLAWQAAVAQWITSEESALPEHHLIAQCYSNFGFPVRKLVPGVSVVNFHYAYPEAVTWNYGLNKPIAYDETGFLGRGNAAYRRQAWNFMLSGGSTFDGLDYSFSPAHPGGNDMAPNGPGGGSPALRSQLHILREFLQSLPLVHMQLDRGTVVHASGVVPRVLSWPGHTYAMYLDGKGPSAVTLKLPRGHYSGRWMNVVTGSAVAKARLSSTGAPITIESPKFTDGIALHLERAQP